MEGGDVHLDESKKNLFAWLQLALVERAGYGTLLKIAKGTRERGIDLYRVLQANKRTLEERFGFKGQLARFLSEAKEKRPAAEERYQALQEEGVDVVTIDDGSYPRKLRFGLGGNAPPIVYFKGPLELLGRPTVAIFSSQSPSSDILQASYNCGQILAAQGINIINGGQTPVDIRGHCGALDAGGVTTLVLPNGISAFHLKRELEDKVRPDRCLILSQSEPRRRRADRTSSLRRNLTITALADAVVVFEALEGSATELLGGKSLLEKRKLFVLNPLEVSEIPLANTELIDLGGLPLGYTASGDLDVHPILESLGLADEKKDMEPPSRGWVVPRTEERERKRRKDLGQYFTPREVVQFMVEMVRGSPDLKLGDKLSTVDPACGEGIFLQVASEKGISSPENMLGCDVDPNVKTKWPEAFKEGKVPHLLCPWDGLLDNPSEGFKKGTFDLAIGNPPFGGAGLIELSRLIEEGSGNKKIKEQLALFGDMETKSNPLQTDQSPAPLTEAKRKQLINQALEIIEGYESWRILRGIEEDSNSMDVGALEDPERFVDLTKNRAELLANLKMTHRKRQKQLLGEDLKALKRLVRFPIEVLFLERFIQLVRPGGHVAIILPDGIFANTSTQPLRNWILEQGQVQAIIGLPRQVFAHTGVNAKTSILFFRKYRDGESFEQVRDMEVLMASVESDVNDGGIDIQGYFNELLSAAGRCLYGGIAMNEKPQLHSMVTTVRDYELEEGQRWDPGYWDPELIEAFKKVENWVLGFKRFGDFMVNKGITYGQVGKRILSKRGEVIYLQVRNIGYYGEVVFDDEQDMIKEGSHNDPKRSRVKKGDILFINSGWPSLGRCIYLDRDYGKVNVSQHIDVIRTKGLCQAAVVVFFATSIGRKIIQRIQHGVSGQTHISFDQVRSLPIPNFKKKWERAIKRNYTAIVSALIKEGTKDIGKTERAKEAFRNLVREVEDLIEEKRTDITPIEL